MNRIRELRKEKRLSTYDLANMVGTTQPTIHRLETGKRKLTVDWMRRIADALGVAPEDLIAPTLLQKTGDDVSPHTPDDALLKHALQGSTRQLWLINEPVLDYVGINPGDVYVGDVSRRRLSDLRTGDICVIQVYDVRDLQEPRTLLRQFIEPSLFITNSSQANEKPLDSRRIDVTVLGVLLPQTN